MKIFRKSGRGLVVISLAALCVVLSLASCGSDEGSDNLSGVDSQSTEESSVDPQEREDNDSSDPIERLSGKYYIDGYTSAASVIIGTDGSFTAYYASGTVEQEGYVRYETDDSGEKSIHVFVFYTDEGKPYMGFVDSGESRISAFETGNGDYRFVRVD